MLAEQGLYWFSTEQETQDLQLDAVQRKVWRFLGFRRRLLSDLQWFACFLRIPFLIGQQTVPGDQGILPDLIECGQIQDELWATASTQGLAHRSSWFSLR